MWWKLHLWWRWVRERGRPFPVRELEIDRVVAEELEDEQDFTVPDACHNPGHRLYVRLQGRGAGERMFAYPEKRAWIEIRCQRCGLERLGHVSYRGADLARYHLHEILAIWKAPIWTHRTSYVDEYGCKHEPDHRGIRRWPYTRAPGVIASDS